MGVAFGILGLIEVSCLQLFSGGQVLNMSLDLSLAGRVVTADKSGNFTSRLVKIDRPVLRIPTLAIHRASPIARVPLTPLIVWR
jgi:aspartyl aminopeptidase